MNKQILEHKLERLRMLYNLTNDYIEGKIIQAQIELLETLIEAL